jgi:ketosteroid isomerase-like protein
MDTVDWSAGTSIPQAGLPAVITTYLAAHQVRDVDAAIAVCAPDAVVTDEGRTYHGRDEIRAWLGGAAREYTFTTTFAGATQVGDDHVDVLQHLEGDFPGGVADLHFRFTVRDGSISRLVIEP